MIAKLDILDSFEEVKIGVSYKHKGKVLESFPGRKIIYLFVCLFIYLFTMATYPSHLTITGWVTLCSPTEISFPEPSLPLISGGTGNKILCAFRHDGILELPILLRMCASL